MALITHANDGSIEAVESVDSNETCVHVVPHHDGWSEDETVAWLGQGLTLPNVEPVDWSVIWWRPPSGCEICHH